MSILHVSTAVVVGIKSNVHDEEEMKKQRVESCIEKTKKYNTTTINMGREELRGVGTHISF